MLQVAQRRCRVRRGQSATLTHEAIARLVGSARRMTGYDGGRDQTGKAADCGDSFRHEVPPSVVRLRHNLPLS
jgi:hypothetical protein